MKITLSILKIILCFFSFGIPSYCQVKTCIDIIPENRNISGSQNGVYDYNCRWTNGATIKVKFVGGSQYIRSKVISYSKIWENYANIYFDYIEWGNSDILISFESGKGSWSQIGTNAKYYSAKEMATMNFGWFNDYTEDAEFKRTTLHEFGHALGLLHEHKNPYGNINWNLPVVYNHYQSQGWSISRINEQVISKYSVTLSNHKYDEYSVMHYPIPSTFTTNGYSVGWNRDLSDGDKELISEMYPKRKTVLIKKDSPTTPLKYVSCSLENIKVDHNVYANNQLGMKIYLSFTINNAQFTTCRASAYFYYAGGTPLKDFNSQYNTTGGNVASGQTFTPNYENSKFTKLEIFMPYDELEMSDGEHDLKFSVSIWSPTKEELIQSGSYHFTYTKGAVCKDLQVLTNFNDNNRTMEIMPKFTIKNAQNLNCSACVYFYYQDGTPLTTLNYTDLSFCQSFKPAYSTTLYNNNYFSDLYLTVPYNSINIPLGTYNIKYFVALFNNGKKFATSSWYTASFSR